MVRLPRPNLTGRRTTALIPTAGGGAAAVLVALFFLILPAWRLEAAVEASGLAQVLPWAQPPLGLTARALVLLGGAVLAGAVAWSALYLVWGPGGFLAPKPTRGDVPIARRADTHPDAPTRRPLSAGELGVPPSPPTPPTVPVAPPPPPVEQPLPADLDQPLAAFHPAAIPDVPLEPVRAIRPLAEPVAAERIATFALPVPEPTVPPPAVATPIAPGTLDSLIERLEQGVGRRAQLVRR